MSPLSRALAASALAWPLLLGASLLARQGGQHPLWTSVVYAAAARICHQLPDRSFWTGGVQWPVCGRCSGLYASAPVGAMLAIGRAGRAVVLERMRWWLAVAAVPTALTLGLEWLGLAPMTNGLRAASALPLGAAIAFVLVRVADRPVEADRLH